MSEYGKPSRAEDEYFARQDLDRKKQWAKDNAAKMASSELESLKAAHWMKCPKCGHDLHTVDLHGVKVDTCPVCGGSWLDAGELDHLMHPERKDLFHRVMSAFR